jgi:FkbM family methyltransferase
MILLSKIKHRIANTFVRKPQANEIEQLKKKYSSIVKEITEINANTFHLLLKSGNQIYVRKNPHSDLMVFDQIFSNEEYLPACSYISLNFAPNTKNLNIIDAGANVGYTSIYLAEKFPHSKVYSIEPDKGNFEQLTKNLEINDLKGVVTPMRMALHGTAGLNLLTKDDFRDGKDWAITIEETKHSSDLQSISVGEILKKFNLTHLDILKIDIEGAERFLFTEDCDLEYLKKTSCIIIEIHDEFNCREHIYSVLGKNGFLIIDLGESTIAINMFMLPEKTIGE